MAAFWKYTYTTWIIILSIISFFKLKNLTLTDKCLSSPRSSGLVEKKSELTDKMEHPINSSNQMNRTDVPNVIVQYGIERTASTLQFDILCVILCLIHETESEKVGCAFLNLLSSPKYQVMKIDRVQVFVGRVPPNSWVFLTSGSQPMKGNNNMKTAMNIMIKKNISVKLDIPIALTTKRGYHIVYEYQKIFGLSNEQMKHLEDYIRHWEILRQCCGMQMSKHWRTLLHQRSKEGRNLTSDNSHHKCESFNISEFENNIMNTYVYKRFANIPTVTQAIGRPSIFDGELDGTYCQRCELNITRYQLGLNELCS